MQINKKYKKTTPIEMFENPVILNNASRLCLNLTKRIKLFLTKEEYYRSTSSALLKLSLLDLIKGTSNDAIARHFGYHPYYLSMIFKKAKKISLRRYLSDYRVHVAKDMLITTDYDINTIAWKTGFNSASYFIKSFSQATGTTPKAFRKENTVELL